MGERDVNEAAGRNRAWSLSEYLAALRRRKWVVLQAVVVVPLIAIVLALRQDSVYRASADVLLNRTSVGATVLGVQEPFQDPVRYSETQAAIARVPEVAARAARAANIPGIDGAFVLGSSFAVPGTANDLLRFSVESGDPEVAVKLATAYAQAFIDYHSEVDTAALREARRDLNRRRQELRAADQTQTVLYANLSDKEQELRTLELLQSRHRLIRPATDAPKVAPEPKQNAMLGIAFGLLLGLALAFVLEMLDTRVRDPEELADRLGLRLLASLPEPARVGRSNSRIVMLNAPNSPDAEPYRMLRTSLEVTAFGGGCRSLMVTSALANEGKSTTAANLAIALARAGRHVILVDLDLRRPSLDRYFALKSRPGITDIVLGRSSPGDAGLRLTFGDMSGPANTGDLRLLRQVDDVPTPDTQPGVLDVIGSGMLPPNPGEFMVTPELEATLKQLRDRADVLVVDAPPLLLAGEALTLSAKVDAILLVARMNSFRWGQVNELERTLIASPTVKLGLVATSHAGAPKRSYYGFFPMTEAEERITRGRTDRVRGQSQDGDATIETSPDDESEREADESGRSAAAGRRTWV
jgi:polysaccharide biosynthesis transport protein